MRHARRRTVAALAAVALSAAALSSGVLGVPTAAADDLKDRQRQNKQQIETAEDNLHSSSKAANRAKARAEAASAQLASAQGALVAADSQVSDAEVRDAQMQAELEDAIAELARARKALRVGLARMDVQQEQVAATITDFYQQGDPSLIAFSSLLDADTPADLALQSEMRSAMVDRESHSYQELLATKVLLDVNETQVEVAKDQVEAQRLAAAQHLEATEVLRDQAKSARDAVATLVSERKAAQQSAAQAEAADQRALAQLEAEEQRISDMLRRRAEEQGSESKPGPSSGVLMAPVQDARLSSPYGYRKHPIYGYWGLHDGQDWAASCGSPLYATTGGRIASSYYSTVYGHRLVLDHGIVSGVGLASIYNHATHYTVGVGERVTRGQVIGYVGSTGWSTGCHLHFSVMVNGSTVDPRDWL